MVGYGSAVSLQQVVAVLSKRPTQTESPRRGFAMPYVVGRPLRDSLIEGREVYPFVGPPARYLIRGRPFLQDGGADRDSPACGVYAIRCERTGRSYVGSTRFFNSRWSEHLSALRRSLHKNRWLLREWEHFGPDAFVFEVLERMESHATKWELRGIEQVTIQKVAASGGVYNLRGAYDRDLL